MYVYERSSEQLWMPCCWTRRKSNEAEASFFSGFRFIIVIIFFLKKIFLNFSFLWPWMSERQYDIQIPNFQIFSNKGHYFYHLCQNSNRAPMMIISILLPHVHTPLFDLAQHGRYYLHSTWKLEILIIAPWYSISFEIRTLNHDFYLSTWFDVLGCLLMIEYNFIFVMV